MTLHPLFVAGVLEGFEGTLGEMAGRVENQELNTQLDALRRQVAVLRIYIEEPLRRGKATRPHWRHEVLGCRRRHPAERWDDQPVPISVTGVSSEESCENAIPGGTSRE
jgi:hypothetical protein